jgi:hypothetical protein
MANKKLEIEQLKEGFLCTDEENERYAVSSLLPWITKYFSVSEEPKKKS